MNRLLGVVLSGFFCLLASGCSEPPSCQQAMNSYYAVGCTFWNVHTNTPTPLTTASSICLDMNASTSDDCRDEFEDWLVCVDEVASSSACDCTRESDAYFACR